MQIESGYLKTPPGILTLLAVAFNLIAFICVITTEEKASVHGGFLLAATILGSLSSTAAICCHLIVSLARRIPPYPFALAQVCNVTNVAKFWIILGHIVCHCR